MYRCKDYLSFAMYVGFLLFVAIPSGWAIEQPVKKVMVIHSYGANHVCGKPQGDGVKQALADKGWEEGKNLQLRSYYMDTKKVHVTPQAIREQARIARQKIDNFRPDVVVVLDDNAIREVMLPLVGRDDLSVVFSGMNGQPADYNQRVPFMQPSGNITGVYEKLWVEKSLLVMGEILDGFGPQDKVVGITDFSPTGNAISRQFDLELGKTNSPVHWQLERVKDFSEYRALIEKLNADEHVRAIYPAALRLETEKGEVLTAPDIFAWTIKHSRKPEMALNYHFSKIGLLGGAAVDFDRMGYKAGVKAARILSGERAGELPIEDAEDFAIVFNLERAKQLDIQIPEPMLQAADEYYTQLGAK